MFQCRAAAYFPKFGKMVRKFDFLIIGSGVAGMSYALQVAEAGKGKVALVCKTSIEEARHRAVSPP